MKAALVRMNQCVCGACAGQPCHGRGLPERSRHHQARRETARLVAGLLSKHTYVDGWTTSYGTLVHSPVCEHCDGERSQWVRNDGLRGWICPLCDDSLDAMYAETDNADDERKLGAEEA